MDACAYLEEPIVMTFGEFRFGVNKEGSYRLEVPISSEFSAVDSNFSSSDEEFSSTYFVDNKASGKLAKIFSNTSFESSADSFISSDSDSVDSFNFIDKSAAIGKKARPSNRAQKVISRQVFMAEKMPPPTVEYLNWSGQDIGFTIADHPQQVPRPGQSALILPAIAGFDVSRVFIDGGSSLNLMMSNDEADVLANIGSQCLAIPPGVFWEEISERSTKPAKIKEKKEKPSSSAKNIAEEEEEQDLVMMVQIPWMQAYISYILRKTIPDDPVEARRVIRRSKAFTVVKGELYKRSISGVLQRCVTPEEGRIILKDVHEGICGHHASSRAIAAKVFRAGFYWLTAIEDAKEIVRTCDACQRFAARPHSPAAELMPIPLSWPFAQWGLDMVGKLHKASPGGYEYLLVAVDKFTKWIEAKPINSPDAASAIKFVKSIVFRFGVPHSIVTDNGSNFTSKEFKAYDTSPTNPSKEIFSELDETFAQGPIFARSFQKTEDLTKWGHEEARGWPARPGLGRAPCPRAPRVALALTLRLLKASVAKPAESHDTENLTDAAAANPISGILEIASGTLPERGFISRRTLHRHGRLRSDDE
ncbi:hypothetical protein QYE76_031492 [Lolium multiflorum]|uniref:Integrase catalytic domain-containing protein n=1 Tax=Lolium multiflorum TaxID=4521 RepID=A0AAD8VII4_LOLMU|nr:hypothetical protein QYE76_031492 [Lolium multiflorum]